MPRLQTIRSAFTMIELIFAIVILGIVASIGSEIIVQTYDSYIIQRAQYRANIKTELALNQVANRLRYAIPGTILAREKLGEISVPIEDVTNANMKVLQWVGYDGDSFEAISETSRKPGWSGLCDLDPTVTTNTNIRTPGSNLELASTIIANLGGNIANARIYFAEGNTAGYDISDASSEENITLDNDIPAGDIISERYKLAWSSYALEIDAKNRLVLHYNFTPATNTDITGQQSSFLLHNVTNFRFKYSGGAFRLKICVEESIGSGADAKIHACKEKVVF